MAVTDISCGTQVQKEHNLDNSLSNKSNKGAIADCQNNESVDRLYFCPMCDTPADGGTIACEQCEEWFHFSCVGLQDKEIERIGDCIPYVCEACSDNVLYGSAHNSPSVSVSDRKAHNISIQQFENENPDNLLLDNNDSSQGVNPELAKINQDKTQTFSNNSVTGSVDPKASNVTLGESNTAFIKSIDQTFHPSDIHAVERENSDSMVSIDTDKTQNPLISNIQYQKRKSKSTIDHEVEPAKQKKINQKNTNKEETEHKIYIMDLERKIREQEKTINLLTQRMNLNSDQLPHTSSALSEDQNRGINNPINQVRPNMKVDNSDAQYQMMDLRIRQMEMNLLQNASIFTLCTAQMSLQMQNQNAVLNSINIQQHSNRSSHLFPAPSYMPPFYHPIPLAQHFLPHVPYPMPHVIPQMPHFMYTRPPTAFPPPGMQPNLVQRMAFPEPQQPLGQPMQQHVNAHPVQRFNSEREQEIDVR